MSVMLRRAMMLRNKEESWLPSIYQQAQYLQSSGYAYIQFSLPTAAGDVVKVQTIAQYTGSATNDVWIAGDGSATADKQQFEIGYYNNAWYTPNATTVTATELSGTGINALASLTYTKRCPSAATYDWRVFGRGGYAASTGSGAYDSRFYRMRITVNGVVTNDLIPCYRKSDNEVGMYDAVARTFLTNAYGAGTLTAGPMIQTLFHGWLYNGMIGSDGRFSGTTARVTNTPNVTPLVSDLWLDAGTYTISAVKINSGALDIMSGSVITKNAEGTIIDNYATSWHDFPFTFTLAQGAYCSFTMRNSPSWAIVPENYIPIITRA